MFLTVLRRRPVQALRAAYFYATRRRVRAGNRLRAAGAALPDVYRLWIRTVERRENRARVSVPDAAPTICIVVDAAAWTDRHALDRTLRSIRAQDDPSARLILQGGAPAAADGDFTVIVPPGAILPRWAVARYRAAACADPDAVILYGDEDVIDPAGRRVRPWFKPHWNADLILAQDYVSHACAVATRVLRDAAMRLPPEATRYALILAVAAGADARVRHIPHILCHMPPDLEDDVAVRVAVVADHVAPQRATAAIGPFGTVQVRWPLPDLAPSVTIVVPTRDRVDLLEACVGSVLRDTDYPDYDILVVDNGSVLPETRAWFDSMSADRRVSVLSWDHPYNYSAINNAAAQAARGDYLCLLNNDTEVIDGAWLGALMRHAVRPGVGAVGAKLLYPDRSIQHAGVVLGLGNAAGHAHRLLPDDRPGYFALAHSAHTASAVTAACLVVERAKFAAVGGLDETELQIAYNDVDLCLKLARAGWRSVYAPEAVLIHHESKSRGADLSPRHIERYRRELGVLQQRWGTATLVDPMHHPRLDRSSETYRLQL